MPNGASSRPARRVPLAASWRTTSRRASSAGSVGDRPAVARVGGAVVDDRHGDAVAEVVGRERDDPGVAEVQHAVVADRPAAVGDQLGAGSGASTASISVARGAYQAPSVTTNSAGHDADDDGGDAEQAERLAPPERAPGDVARRTRRRDAAAEIARPRPTGRQQDADLGDPERQRVAVLQDRRAARNTTTRPAARAAHVNRHARATSRATRTGTYRARASDLEAGRARSPSTPRRRGRGPVRRRAAAPTRSSHDHVVDHGRLSTNAADARHEPERPPSTPAVRTPALTASVVSAEHDGDDDEHRQHGRGEGDGDGGRRGPATAVRRTRSRGAQVEHAVDEVGAVGRRVGGADAGGDAQQVHEPRHGGVGDEGADSRPVEITPGTSGIAV